MGERYLKKRSISALPLVAPPNAYTKKKKKKKKENTILFVRLIVIIFIKYYDKPGIAAAHRGCFSPRQHSIGNDETLRKGVAYHYIYL